MSTRTKEIQAVLRAQQSELQEQAANMQEQAANIASELMRIGQAIRALDGDTTQKTMEESIHLPGPVTSAEAMRELTCGGSDHVAQWDAETGHGKVPLTGGGPGGFGSPGSGITLGVTQPTQVKKRTPKRSQPKQAASKKPKRSRA